MKGTGNGFACDPQAWAYKLATGTFSFVVIVSALAQVYQTCTGKGRASQELTDNMKSAMLVLSGMLAASKLMGSETRGTREDPTHTEIVNKKTDPVPTVEGKEK